MLYLRLNELLEENKISWQELAEIADIPVETMRNIYYGKVRDPKISTMLAISKALHVSINYLIGDRIYTHNEEKILTCYRKCGNHGKSVIMLVAEYEAFTALAERDKVGRHKVPCIVPNKKVEDGMKYSTYDNMEIYTVQRDAYLAIVVPNNSWAPVYCMNDILLLEKRFPNDGENALFTVDNCIYFRKYVEEDKKYLLKCPNDMYKTMVFDRMDKIYCLGTCIGIVRDE